MGEYFTPEWLADSVITEALTSIDNPKWSAIDPCCGSGIFIIALIKKVVGDVNLNDLSEEERKQLLQEVLNRVHGIDINPLSVLSARVSYYVAIHQFGDIKDIESAKRMFSYTGCDAIMIGRGVLGNPWLIKELVTYFDNGTIIDKPSYKEKIDMCFHHMDYLMKIKPEKVAVLEMRSHIAWYLKGMNGSQEVKNAIFRATNREDIEKILNNYLKKLENSI